MNYISYHYSEPEMMKAAVESALILELKKSRVVLVASPTPLLPDV